MTNRAATECNSLRPPVDEMCQLPLASQRDVPYRGDIRGEGVTSGVKTTPGGMHNDLPNSLIPLVVV